MVQSGLSRAPQERLRDKKLRGKICARFHAMHTKPTWPSQTSSLEAYPWMRRVQIQQPRRTRRRLERHRTQIRGGIGARRNKLQIPTTRRLEQREYVPPNHLPRRG